MEKKTPEKKMLLRQEDIFFVYDKRINKCVKDGCDGIVKYGLTLKVMMPNGDTLNTYECNKCHMKYTANPNYVRLKTTEGLLVYNKEEVAAREKKRATDAAKQAARERRAERAKKLGMKKFKKKFDKKYDIPYDKKNSKKKKDNKERQR